jgi:hypothetical protein
MRVMSAVPDLVRDERVRWDRVLGGRPFPGQPTREANTMTFSR